MKGIAVCGACRRVYLAEAHVTRCPACGGVLMTTGISEERWNTFTAAQQERLRKDLLRGGAAPSPEKKDNSPWGILLVIAIVIFLFCRFRQDSGAPVPGGTEAGTAGDISVSPEDAGDMPWLEQDLTWAHGYYYRFLESEGEREAYDCLVWMCENGVADAWFREILSPTAAVNAQDAVRYDHPEYFWIFNSVGLHLKEGSIGGYSVDFPENWKERRAELVRRVDAVVSAIPAGYTDYDVAKYFFDYIISNTAYGGDPSLGQTADRALLDGLAVCGGYSAAYKLLCERGGIPCLFVTGESGDLTGTEMGRHAWNQVWIDGSAYWVDVTWGDYEFFDTSRCSLQPIYKWLCAPDSIFLQDHVIDPFLGRPREGAGRIRAYYEACTETRFEFYHLINARYASWQEAVPFVQAQLLSGTDHLWLAFPSEQALWDAKFWLLDQEVLWEMVHEAGIGVSECSYSVDESSNALLIEFV